MDERVDASTNASDAARATRPRFAERANAIAREARELKAGDLKTLMGVSDAIAKLNVERFGNFEKAATKACALAFDGPAFRHLKASTLKTEEEKAYLQKHLRILSGLYGCLRPYDAIAPYRLEMGTKWAPSGKDLYAYWGEDIALAIADDLDEQAATSERIEREAVRRELRVARVLEIGQARGVDEARRRRVHDDVSRTRSVRQTSSRSHGSTLRRRSSGFARRSENLSGHGRVLEV